VLNLYLSSLEGDVYFDAIASSLAEAMGCLLGGMLMRYNIKITMVVANLMPALGAIGLVFQERFVFISIINLGIGACFVLQSTLVVKVVKGDKC
jgi:hypothetical protein